MTKQEAIAKANEKAYSDYHINLGIERKAVAKTWERDGEKREYIRIDCYTMAGKYKGNYKCGYVVEATGEYVPDEIDLNA